MDTETVAYDKEELPTWELRLRKVMLVIARIGLAYLYFTQLFWKLPPDFGCPSDFGFTTGNVDSNGRVQLQRTSGLCDWIGIENVWANQPRPFFVANIDNQGSPEISIDLGWAAKLNNFLLETFVMPYISWFGLLIWAGEAFIFVSLFFGIFSRGNHTVKICAQAGSRRDSGWRNPRSGDRGDGLKCRRDRSLGLDDPAHARCQGRRYAVCRSVSETESE